MATTRERFYECSFASGGQTRTGYVRAWSATDAKRVFAEMLSADGVEPTGRIDAVAVGERTRTVGMPVPGVAHLSNA